ncbi:hypothetical protein BSNK01_01820 [Bacillaceae bacterium]
MAAFVGLTLALLVFFLIVWVVVKLVSLAIAKDSTAYDRQHLWEGTDPAGAFPVEHEKW